MAWDGAGGGGAQVERGSAIISGPEDTEFVFFIVVKGRSAG